MAELEHKRKARDEVIEEGESQLMQGYTGHVKGFVFYPKCSVNH